VIRVYFLLNVRANNKKNTAADKKRRGILIFIITLKAKGLLKDKCKKFGAKIVVKKKMK
jgi:hypothetical protein